VAALIASFIMAMAGIQVIVETIRTLWKGEKMEPPNLWSAGLALVCAVAMFGVYLYNRRLARQINNNALMAAAKDNLSDAMVSVGASVGIVGAQFGLPWIDSVAAFMVGIIICITAWSIFKECTYSLTDGFDQNQIMDLRSTIAGVHGVEGIKDVKARVHGSHVLVDVVIEVQPNLSVSQGHEITDRIEEQVKKEHNIMQVQIHVEPK